VNVRRRFLGLSGLIVIFSLVAGCTSAGGLPSLPTSKPAVTAPPSAAPSTGSNAYSNCPTSAPPPLPAGQTRTVTIDTSQGQIVLKVDGSLSPNAAGNFVALAECGWYNGVVFHRLVPGFVIQGGDGEFGRAPNVDGTQVGSGGPGYTIQDEPVKGTYKRGTLAMARTSQPNSQGSQFFIVLDDGAQPALESARTYAIFGEVLSGMDTVDKIGAMPNSGEATGNAALKPVPMDKLTVTTP
jgi:peptidyl-prolyl cis-trans isomerase B (cyclophilin B)